MPNYFYRKRSGNMLDIRSKQGDIRFSTPINEGSKRKFMLQQEDYILLKFSVAKPIPFKLGDWVKIDGDPTSVFELSKIIRPKQNNNTGGYDYELRLDAYYYKWANKIVKYMPEHGANEATFDLTTDLATHLSVVIRNLKALGYKFDEKDFTFSIDATVKHEHKHIRYEKTNIIDLLNRLADTWSCEWWIVGNVIHFGKCQFGDPIPFEVGKNVETMGSSNDNKRVATRIYAFGSSRNITKDYRHTSEQAVVNGIVQKRLMLPADTPYIDAYSGMSQEEAIEDVVFFEDIYPRRIGSISSVSTKEYTDTVKEDGKPDKTVNWNAYRFTDTGINFSEKYVLPSGDGLKIVFQSGSLNGMEFEVWFNPDKKPEKNDEVWNPEAQVYEIKRNEDYGRPLPDEKLFPKVGDKYILSGFDTSLVSDVYVPQAEQELKAEAEKYVQKSIIDPSTYENRMMSDAMFDEEGNVSLHEFGQRVKLINPAYFENGRLSRIIGYEYDLAVPYDSPTYTVGEVAPKGRIGEIESKVDNLTYKGQTYFGAGGGVYLITSRDSTMPSDHSAFSSRRSVMEFLSRRNRDTAHAHLTFREGLTSEEVVNALKGMKFGEYASGLTGFGGHIDDKGRAELESLFLRSFLEVPELRYNRVRVITGEEWNSKGGGIIESIDEENKSFQLKLEAGEHPSVSEGDICKLVYNTGAGFGTCYFRVLSVTPEGVVRYALREGYDMHPKAMSHFVAYGNFFDETRQASAYSTTSYTRYLKGVNDWEIRKENIAMQFGDLSNLRVHGMQLEGYSAYLNNVYFTGTILQLSPEQIKEIADKVDSPYSVTLSSYERVIKESGEGLRQELKVVTGDKQVMTQGKEVVTSQYSLSTHITVLRGSKELLYSATVEEGTYTATLRAHGLSASINAGNIVVTSVGDKGGHVDIEVNCEGKAIITKRFSVVVVKDGVGRYTESRYMHSDTMPETPTGRHPKGWSKSSRSPRETISITEVRSFEKQGESYVLDLINTDQGSIVHQATEGEQYVTYHVKGQDHSGEGVYIRLFDFATAKTLYERTLYGSFDETLRIHIPQGVRAVLSARGRRKASHEQTYTTVRLTRADSSVCWETRAEITPSLHDIEGATVVPTWSTPTVYKTVTKRTRLTPSHVLSKLTSVGGYSPSSYTVAHMDDENNLVRTSMVLYTSSDGLSWVRKETHKDVSTMAVRVGADATYYKVRTYEWVDGNTSYTSGYLHESNGVVVGDGRDGANGKDGKAPRISADGYWEYWDGSKWVKTDVKAQGTDGRVGAMPVPTGVYKQGREYYYNDHVRHVVLYRAPGDSRMYPYLVRNYSQQPVTVPPTGHTDDPNWVRSNYMEFVATEVIMAEGGYLAGFIFRSEKLISQRGLFEGREVDIADVPSDKVGAFVPNISLDGKRGDITIRGSVATPFVWDYSGDAKVKETIIISRDSYNRFNNVGLTFYAHENGKTIRIKNVHDKTVKLHLRMYLQALARDPSKGSEIVEVSIPPGAMLSGIIAPDVRTLQEYPNGVYQEIINGVLTNVGYIVGIHPITPMQETETTTSGYRKFVVGYTVTKPAKEIKVVAAGRVRGNGSHELKTGAFTGSSRDSLGAYTVYHSIGHTNYAPTVTAQAQSGTLVAMIKNLTANYFEVEISTDTGNYEDGAFSFSCVAEV